MIQPRPGLSLALLLTALALPVPAYCEPNGSQSVYVEQGAWFATLPHSPDAECTLNTGGYDRAGKTQNPTLSVTLHQRDDGGLQIALTATAVTTLSRADLGRLRTSLHVTGGKPLMIRAVPSAIVETSYDRRLTLRPIFPGSDGDAGMERLIAAMRVGDRMVAEINGRALEPAFSLRGFDSLWQQAMQHCGAAGREP
jgi:hypothetical protein